MAKSDSTRIPRSDNSTDPENGDFRRTIIRAEHRSAYFSMTRASAQDDTLSYEAGGLLTYLLSLPDDWVLRPSTLQKRGAGRDKVRAMLNELRDAGYIEVRSYQRDDKHRFARTEYIVHEVPCTEKPYTAKPPTEMPAPANPSAYIVHTEQSTQDKKDSASFDAGTGAIETNTPSESKRGRKKNAGEDNPTPHAGEPPAPPRPRDPMFDAVALHVFGFQDAGAKGGRVAMIANWLKGTYEGEGKRAVGYISQPASPEHVAAFVQWWRASSPSADVPCDLVKFVEHWRKWAAEINRKRQAVQQRQAQLEQRRAQAASLTAEERESALAAMRAARAQQREAVAS